MSDDRFDTWIGKAARDYHQPPPSEQVPREEMWAAIEAGVREGDRARQTARPDAWRRPVWLAAAAVALVAAGLAGGYWLRGPGASPARPVVAAADSAQTPGNRSLEVALAQHLTDAEALLVAYRGEESAPDTTLGRWARDVLGTTRLLLDSPVATSPVRRRLLEDLELVLIQIANLSPRASQEERDLAAESLTRGQLLTRLRSTVPAGMASGT